MSQDISPPPEQVDCTCGAPMEQTVVDVTMQAAGGLVVIEDVPARICTACQEQYYDKATSLRIQELVSQGFPRDRIVREMTVPVYSLRTGEVPTLPEDIEH